MQQTEKKKEAFCEAIARGLKPEEAARSAGVDRTTAYRWRSEDPTFMAQWADAQDRLVEDIESTLYEMAKGKDLGAVCFFLKSNRPEKYNRRTLVLEGNADAPLNGQVMIYPKGEGKA